MDRRKVLLIVGALVAALGTGVVFLYASSANSRADQKFAARQVLVAKAMINPGESVSAAKSAGKFETKTVTAGSLVPGFVADTSGVPGKNVALTTIYPGEQIMTSKFGATPASGGSALSIPKKDVAISLNLDDPNRVAGFLNPGDSVAVFATGGTGKTSRTRVLLPEVTVIAVGTTTVVSTTKTDASGAQTTEQLPRTLLTLAVDQSTAEKVILATRGSGMTLTFGLRTKDSEVIKTEGTSTSQLFN